MRVEVAAAAAVLALLVHGSWGESPFGPRHGQRHGQGQGHGHGHGHRQDRRPEPPPDGLGYTELRPGEYYKVHAQRVAWSEAEAECKAEGALLAVLTSLDEAALLRELLGRTPDISNELHAGFYLPNNFVTVFGTPFDEVGYQRWAPDQNYTQTCGTVNHNVLLYDAKCADKRSFICKISINHVREPPFFLPPSSRRGHPRRYEPTRVEPGLDYQGLMQQGRMHYYRVNEGKLRWSRAKAVCEEEGAHLLVLSHQMEAETLREHIKSGFDGLSDHLHVGLLQAKVPFVTLFKQTVEESGYSQWESEQPEDETCLMVDRDMLLKKAPCWEERSFICEMTLI